MSLKETIMGTVARFMPDPVHDTFAGKAGIIGQPVTRVDGLKKVTGEATFTAEYKLENVACAALVYSSIAKGHISSMDLEAAKNAPGVVEIITYQNIPPLKAPPLFNGPEQGSAASTLPVMQSDEIFWNGQPIAVVVAETQDQADHAAFLVKVEYTAEPADLSFDKLKPTAKLPSDVLGKPPEVKVGDPDTELLRSDVIVDNFYHTPRYNHNAIELHATLARWEEDGGVTVYDASQSVSQFKNTIAITFGLETEQVRVLAPFVGGGFGGKGMSWNHTLLCVAAAKLVKRPVKLVVSREGVFREVGGRTLTEQRVALGATKDGHLRSLIHTGTTAVVSHNKFPEQFTFPARSTYAADGIFVSQKIVPLNTVANTAMRAPGEAVGTFALESAIDELAYALKMDPIELRRLNEPEKDPLMGLPFSSRDLVEAYRRGAEKFGWSRRNPEPRSQRDGHWLIGQGVATAAYPYMRMPCSARLTVLDDGTVHIQTAAHEMGMGTATVQIQLAAEKLGLPMDKVSFEYGDSSLPTAPTAGGSAQSASIIAAVEAAIAQLKDQLLEIAGPNSALGDVKDDQVEVRDGGLYRTDKPELGESFVALLKKARRDKLVVEANAPQPAEIMKYSMHSHGAQFCEVRVNDVTGEVRISRWLGSFDTGRILNARTAASQFRGGIIMGIGMALSEEAFFDERQGRVVNASMAEYHVPVHLDVPTIDIIYNDIPDEHTPMGVHGVGEIGITGVAAAIANAVFNATGKRIRDLPITLDKLL